MTETALGLWLAVLASGLYHGVNPGMGWPLAVSGALFERREGALWRAMGALGLGHLLAMVGILLPFAAMVVLVDYQREIQIGAALLVITMGLWIAITRRHPRFLARVKPGRLTLWSFLVAMAHGAGLMLVPIYLGLCQADDLDMSQAAATGLLLQNVEVALMVAVFHTLAMLASGGALAFGVYRVFGLKFITQSWFNLELFWALSLIGVGMLGLWAAL
jgi:hypothetical protein